MVHFICFISSILRVVGLIRAVMGLVRIFEVSFRFSLSFWRKL